MPLVAQAGDAGVAGQKLGLGPGQHPWVGHLEAFFVAVDLARSHQFLCGLKTAHHAPGNTEPDTDETAALLVRQMGLQVTPAPRAGPHDFIDVAADRGGHAFADLGGRQDPAEVLVAPGQEKSQVLDADNSVFCEQGRGLGAAALEPGQIGIRGKGGPARLAGEGPAPSSSTTKVSFGQEPKAPGRLQGQDIGVPVFQGNYERIEPVAQGSLQVFAQSRQSALETAPVLLGEGACPDHGPQARLQEFQEVDGPAGCTRCTRCPPCK